MVLQRDPKSVFLNVPFDDKYEPLFVTLIAGLVGLGYKPRCVLELASSEQRLDRIYKLISECGSSIHDLCRPNRFNMPFELGIAWGLSRGTNASAHQFFVLDSKPNRLVTVLSDLRAYDPHAHRHSQAGALDAVMNCYGRVNVALDDLQKLQRDLRGFVTAAKQVNRWRHIRTKMAFTHTVALATYLAQRQKLIT